MSAVSALLKIGYTSLKIRNLSPFHSAFEQTDFLRFVPPIFLTLTSQGGNQGIANAMDKKQIRLREIPLLHCKYESPITFSAVPKDWRQISNRQSSLCERKALHERKALRRYKVIVNPKSTIVNPLILLHR